MSRDPEERSTPRESRAHADLQTPWWLLRRRGPATSSPRTGAPADETLLARRPLYVIAVGLIILALILRVPLLVAAGLVVLVLAVVPEIWYRFGSLGLRVSQAPAVRQVMFGDEVDLIITVENRQPLPLPWIELTDELPSALPASGVRLRPSINPERDAFTSVLGVWAYQRVRRRVRLRCLARGAFRFGPLRVRQSDPFGILVRERQIDQPSVLLVYPLVAPLERFGLPARSPFGELKSSRRLLEDPLRVAGVRPYQPGDEPRRVHWKASARTGTLQSKIYEPSTRHTLALFVDTRTFDRTLYGYDPLLAELAITTTASVAAWALEQGYAVGVYSNGILGAPELDEEMARQARQRVLASAEEEPRDPAPGTSGPTRPAAHGTGTPPAPTERESLARRLARLGATQRLRVPPASNPAQLGRVQEGLARLIAGTGLPMETVLTAEQGRLPLGTTVIFIGAEAVLDVPLIVAMRRLKAAGHDVTLLLTGAAETAAAESGARLQLAGLTIHRIGGREIWNELVADATGQRSEGRRRGASRPAAESGPEQRTSSRARTPRALVLE
jgi:uncharacterized protein (DUF58 family)